VNKSLYLFDFDHTLIKGDSFFYFLKHTQKRRKLILGTIKFTPRLVGKLFGLGDLDKLKESIFNFFFSGISEKQFNNYCLSFVPILQKLENPETIGVIKSISKVEAIIVVASASVSNWILPWAKLHNINIVIATDVDCLNGRLTGKFSTANCKGSEKKERIISRLDVNEYDKVVAFGNLPDDKYMFELADEVHVI
jgi:phosphatidylglycerophosphatase C